MQPRGRGWWWRGSVGWPTVGRKRAWESSERWSLFTYVDTLAECWRKEYNTRHAKGDEGLTGAIMATSDTLNDDDDVLPQPFEGSLSKEPVETHALILYVYLCVCIGLCSQFTVHLTLSFVKQSKISDIATPVTFSPVRDESEKKLMMVCRAWRYHGETMDDLVTDLVLKYCA